MNGALADIKVVDLSQDVAGSYCTKLLAGLGAEVIKVEPPDGDPLRHAGRQDEGDRDLEASPSFLYLNTGKKSVVLDLADAAGRARLTRLLASADLVVESGMPGTPAGLAPAGEPVARRHPGLISVSITPFGLTGPYRGYQADELILLAMGGLLFLTGDPDQPPCAWAAISVNTSPVKMA